MLFRSPAWDSVVYWALDLETGGLDPRTDPILAVGMVPLRQG
ncbi:MAG TPA: 3'-5' exonuclease, partial [Anaeromyxobacteraceae bacterium]|nr:3'-5' exonuclease [Anaeromyxobacteraceae bacterium]